MKCTYSFTQDLMYETETELLTEASEFQMLISAKTIFVHRYRFP